RGWGGVGGPRPVGGGEGAAVGRQPCSAASTKDGEAPGPRRGGGSALTWDAAEAPQPVGALGRERFRRVALALATRPLGSCGALWLLLLQQSPAPVGGQLESGALAVSLGAAASPTFLLGARSGPFR
ncbi:hypothetical protein U0070_024031, partial [Myodes glareolus]